MSQDYAEAVIAAQAEQPRCPKCASPDTVCYWAKADTSQLTVLIYREWYPNARKCVDCEHVWW